jgi:hypothetical protein
MTNQTIRQLQQSDYEKPKAKGMWDIWHPLQYKESENGSPLPLFWFLMMLLGIWLIWGGGWEWLNTFYQT